MKRNAYLLICSVAIMIIAASCQKESGPIGPKGDTGSANVIYSAWFTPTTYTKDTIFGIWGLNYNQAAPLITQPVLDSGVVLTYAKLLGYNPAIWPITQVSQMPITLTYVQGSTMTDTWSALATPGNLHIRFTNDKNYYSTIANTHKFRYIVIPGGKAGRRADLSYQEICAMYNIPE